MRDLIVDKDEMRLICRKNVSLVFVDICFNDTKESSIKNNKDETILEYKYKRIVFNIIVDEKGIKYKVFLNNKSSEKYFMKFHVKNIINNSIIDILRYKIERMLYIIQLDDLFKYENVQGICNDIENILKPRGEHEKT